MTKDKALTFDLALDAAYLAGFNASGEGYNGEYPFQDHGAHPEQDAGWIKNRDNEITAIKQARALDKMAENARELGLDYEPADGTQVSKVWWDGEKLMAKPIPLEDMYQTEPVQEPVAWVDLLKQAEEVVRSKSLWKKYIDGTPLANDIAVWMANFAQEHTTPPAAQQEYERGVIDGRQMQAQSSVDKAVNAMSQRQFVGLTDEEYIHITDTVFHQGHGLVAYYLAIEAKLRSKNNG
jgi:hypothetical protein